MDGMTRAVFERLDYEAVRFAQERGCTRRLKNAIRLASDCLANTLVSEWGEGDLPDGGDWLAYANCILAIGLRIEPVKRARMAEPSRDGAGAVESSPARVEPSRDGAGAVEPSQALSDATIKPDPDAASFLSFDDA